MPRLTKRTVARKLAAYKVRVNDTKRDPIGVTEGIQLQNNVRRRRVAEFGILRLSKLDIDQSLPTPENSPLHEYCSETTLLEWAVYNHNLVTSPKHQSALAAIIHSILMISKCYAD